MAQSIAVKPTSQAKICLSCPHFNDFHETNGRGWCQLFDRHVRKNHQTTNDCINSSTSKLNKPNQVRRFLASDSIISHELENNLAFFPNIDFEELDVFPSEEIIDEADLPHAEHQVGSIVKIIDADEDYTEWAVFEVVECLHNTNLHNSTETYLNQSQWYYRLCSHTDGNTMPSENFALDKFLWVAENEICDFDLAHNVCTEEIF